VSASADARLLAAKAAKRAGGPCHGTNRPGIRLRHVRQHVERVADHGVGTGAAVDDVGGAVGGVGFAVGEDPVNAA
jgi:hypothetical protein